jgi:tetratricopeptide (TPR) repeat protein
MMAASSPISSPTAASDDDDKGRKAAPGVAKTDVTPAEPEEIRDLVEAGDESKALEKVQAALARDVSGPDASVLRLVQARLLDRLGRGWESVQVYRDVLEDSTLGATARRELHDLHLRLGQFRAADHLTEADSSGMAMADVESIRLRGNSLIAQGRYAEAEATLATRPDDPRCAVQRAAALLALARHDEAQQIYLAIVAKPAERDVLQAAHYGLGQIARLAGSRAVRALENEKALRLGAMPAAQLDLGLALRALGRRHEATATLETLAKNHPAFLPTANLALARLDEDEGRAEAAIERLVDGLTGSAGDFLALTRLGDLLRARGDEDAAIAAYREALAVFPAFDLARERLTVALAAQGRWEEASGTKVPKTGSSWTWERLLDGDLPYHDVVADRDYIPPGDPRRMVLALVQLRSGFPGGAIAWSEDAKPSERDLVHLRAEALERVGRVEDAVVLWQELLAAGESVLAREGLVRAAVRTKEQGRALEAWEALTRLHPEAARAQRRLAIAFEGVEWHREAKKAYELALSSGWLSADERRSSRAAAEDLADAIEEAEETREKDVKEKKDTGEKNGKSEKDSPDET